MFIAMMAVLVKFLCSLGMVSAEREIISPPGIEGMQYSFNVLLGVPPHEQRLLARGMEMFHLTETGEHMGDYKRYKQLPTMAVTENCKNHDVASKVWYASSSDTLRAISSYASHGYSQTFDLGVEIPGTDVDVSTSIKNSLVLGNSNAAFVHHEKWHTGYEYVFDSRARRTLFAVRSDYSSLTAEDFKDGFVRVTKELGPFPSTADVLGYFQQVGTHGLRYAAFGEMCTSTAFMEGGETMTSYEKFRQDSTSQSIGLLWWQSEHGGSEVESSEVESKYGFQYIVGNKECHGSLVSDSRCSHMTGNFDSDRPGIVSWEYDPIWKMAIPGVAHSTTAKMKSTFEEIMSEAVRCREQYCFGQGVCAPNMNKWRSKETARSTAANLQSLFDGSRCFCDENYVGRDCRDPPPANLEPPLFPRYFQTSPGESFDLDASENAGRPAVYCGMESKYDKDTKDRAFKFATCAFQNGGPQQGRMFLHYSEYFKYRDISCHRQGVWPAADMQGLYSKFSPSRFDRYDRVNCIFTRDDFHTPRHCYFLEKSHPHEHFMVECRLGYAMVGYKSQYLLKDRTYEVRCCEELYGE